MYILKQHDIQAWQWLRHIMRWCMKMPRAAGRAWRTGCDVWSDMQQLQPVL